MLTYVKTNNPVWNARLKFINMDFSMYKISTMHIAQKVRTYTHNCVMHRLSGITELHASPQTAESFV